MRIYIDLVFLANFFGDFLCLCLTSAVYRRISLPRRLAAAVIGGLYGAAAVLPHMGFLGLLPVKAAAAVFIAACAYLPAPPAEALRAAAVFVISSMLLCGGAEFILSNGGGGTVILTVFGAACLLCCALTALRSRIYSRYLPCEICYHKKKLRSCGFYDSGNRLILNETGMRVIVADERVLEKLFGTGACAANLAEWVGSEEILRIPFYGAAGGELVGLKLDYAKVCGRRYDDVALGICENKLPDRIILHSTMV